MFIKNNYTVPVTRHKTTVVELRPSARIFNLFLEVLKVKEQLTSLVTQKSIRCNKPTLRNKE
jgi:hypothetical protein